MTDDEWLAEIERGHLRTGFHHRDHLRLAWLVLEREPELRPACTRVASAVQVIAARHGRLQSFNCTVTEAGVRVVDDCRRQQQPDGGFDELLERRAWLIDKRLLSRHYSSRLLAGSTARTSFVPADIRPLPQ